MPSELSISPLDYKVSLTTNQLYIYSNNQTYFPLNGECYPEGAFVRVYINGAVYDESALCKSGVWSLNVNVQAKPEGQVSFLAEVYKGSITANSTVLDKTKDTIAPAVGFFDDMNFGSSTKSPLLEWGGLLEAGTGVSHLELALGSSPGLTDISDWVSVSAGASTYFFNSLSLTNGTVYYPSLRTKDIGGNTSALVQKDGFRAVTQWNDIKPLSNKNLINNSDVYFVKTFSNDQSLVFGTAGKDSGTYLGYSKLAYFTSNGDLVNPIEVSQIKNPEFVLKQSDGKVIIYSEKTIYRLNADFTIDTTYATHAEPNFIYHMVIQPDNKVLYCNSVHTMVRLNVDGSVDSTFSVGSGANSLLNYFTLQADGKILVGGAFTSFNGQSYNRIVRLSSTGAVDTSFSVGTGFNDQVYAIKLQPDGKILVGGAFTNFNGNARNRIIRLDSTGAMDGTFSIGSGVTGNLVYDIELQSTNKIIITGWFTQYNGVNQGAIARLNTNGSLDGTFNTGTGCSRIYEIAMQSDDKIIMNSNLCTTYNGNPIVDNFFRINSDGTFDSTFNVGNKISRETKIAGESLLVFPDDSFILHGALNWNSSTHSNLYMLDADEKILSTFSSGAGVDAPVLTAERQSDGKIIMGGSFTTYNGTGTNRIVRVSANGVIDPAFAIGTGFNNSVSTVIIQPDQKILVAGKFTTYKGISYNRIIRLLSDGSVDSTFTIGNGFDADVSDMTLLPDGKILVAGAFSSFNGTAKSMMVKLNSNGTLDGSFSFDDTTAGSIEYLVVNKKSEIILGGYFYNDDFSQSYLTRKLTSNGAIDSFFTAYSSWNSIYDLDIFSDDKFMISIDGGTRLVKFNNDGSLDSTFISPSIDAFGYVYAFCPKSDGSLLIGGDFNTYDNRTAGSLLRIGW